MSDSGSHEPDSPLSPHLDEFYAECDEHLAEARQALLALEPAADEPSSDRGALEELFRAFHTVKGLAAMVGLRAVETLAHQLESYLGAVRQRRTGVNSQGFNALVEGTSHLESILEAHRSHAQLPDASHVVESLEALLRAADKAAPTAEPPQSRHSPDISDQLSGQQQEQIARAMRAGGSAWWVTFRPSAELAQRQINVDTIRAQLKSVGELLVAAPKVLEDGKIAFVFLLITQAKDIGLADRDADGLSCVAYEPAGAGPVNAALDVAAEAVRPAASAQLVSPTNVVRVDLERLDDLMRRVGDLVITRARFEQNLKGMAAEIPAAQGRALQENNAAFERQIRDLREGIMRARLVPIRDTFSRMQFIVRDLTRELEKDARVQLIGGETEVDKFIVERAMDPLLHLVRNAVSHGIEPAAQRVAAGKSPVGAIVLRARADGQTVIIEVEDDGRGIDRQEVFATAQRRGLLPAAGGLEDANLLDILCEPGFSTRNEVDRASGRGVGMNVVKRAVEALGGRLSLYTESGKGTRFSMQLPLTLSIADALIFEVAGQTFALPQAAVQEVFELHGEDISQLGGQEIILHRGSALPLVRLSAVFGLSAGLRPIMHAIAIGDDGGGVGLVVDRLVGLHEIVARPMTDPLVRVAGIAGVTELGDGRTVLILDAQSLLRAAGARKFRDPNAADLAPEPLGACHASR